MSDAVVGSFFQQAVQKRGRPQNLPFILGRIILVSGAAVPDGAVVMDFIRNEKNEQTPVENLEVFEIPYEANVNINLQKEAGDEQDHYAVIKGIRVSFDKEADGFSDVKGLIEKNTTYVEDIVKETISSFSSSTISEEKVKEEAVKKLQERYDTKCIVEISLPGFLVS